MPAYCENSDLNTGDVTFTDDTKTYFKEYGADEINATLSQVYLIPLAPIPPEVTLSVYALLNLKRCNILLSSGDMIMDRAASASDDEIHAYGKRLHDEGMMLLMMIRNGQIDIGAIKLPSLEGEGDNPTIINYDATSGVDYFYEQTTSPWNDYVASPGWRPGPDS